jgi:hypothetical protein
VLFFTPKKKIVSYTPSEKQWWITGFNPYRTITDANDLTAVYTVQFNSRTMYNDFISSDSYLKKQG